MKKTVTTIVNIYVLVLMVVFPLFMTDAYYNIQETKLYFYLYSTIIATVMVVLVLIFGWIRKLPLLGIRRSMHMTDWFAAFFLLVVILSTVSSEWKYEAYWGNMGRSQGCFLWVWYICTYILISRFYEPKKWHVDLFLAAALIVCTWGVLDCFWKSPIHWQELHDGGREKAFDFSSTIGNVNILTGLEGIYLAVASTMFLGEDHLQSSTGTGKSTARAMIRPVYYYIVSCAAYMSLVCGLSDNAMISVAAVICFLPFYAFGQRYGVLKYLMLLGGYTGTMVLTGQIAAREGQQIIMRKKWGQLLKIAVDHTSALGKLLILIIIAIMIVGVLTMLYYRKHNVVRISLPSKNMSRGFRIAWTCLGVIAAVVVVYVFYDANTGGHPDLYAPYRKFLVFSDSWGTHRGYNWTLAMKYFRDFPLWKKLVGSGPETYAIYTHVNDHYAMIDMFSETYDSPHNEWLQYLFTTGICGFIGYYGMVISGMICGWAAGRKNVKSRVNQSSALSEAALQKKGQIGAAFAYGILAYTLQSFVNISVPITVPYVIMSIAICVALVNLNE